MLLHAIVMQEIETLLASEMIDADTGHIEMQVGGKCS